MKTLIALLIVVSGAYADATDDSRSTQETFRLFIGEWEMDLVADRQSFGDRGGPGTGTMNCDWGLEQAWLDCALDADYEGLGPYQLKIVLFRTGRQQTVGAFVTNNWGGGRLYTGRWRSPNELVFLDAWAGPERKWQHQRTTYTFRDNGEIHYAVEMSNNGKDYLPHSRGTYRKKMR